MKSLQFITHYTERYSYLDSARMALEGGCRWIQLRMKDAGKEEILPIATEIRKLCNDCGAIFIIDDHVELVRESVLTAYISARMICRCRSAAHTRRRIYHRRYGQHIRRYKEALARRSKLHRLRTVQIYHHQTKAQSYSGFGRI